MAVQSPQIIPNDRPLGEALRETLAAARAGQDFLVEEMTERLRDLSYDMVPRSAAYLVRAACAAIEAALRGGDRLAGLAHAEHEIEMFEDMMWRTEARVVEQAAETGYSAAGKSQAVR